MSTEDSPTKKKRIKAIPRARPVDEERERAENTLAWEECKQHPLSGSGSPVRHRDPLGRAVKLASCRSWRQTQFSGKDVGGRLSTRQIHMSKRLNWKEQKAEILATYTTSKNIPVTSKLVEDEVEQAPKVLTQTDKAKARLEQLDEGHDEQRKDTIGTNFLTQNDLIQHLESLATDLEASWHNGEKVKSLRFAIQACKMLSNTRVPQCYPSLFVLVAKVLDVFGSLVYERIYQRAVETLKVKKLDDNFSPAEITNDTKEMCKNWFYKVASIRELIPRIMVEMCLWRCYRFVAGSKKFFNETLVRFARQIRGVGDPLVANYVRLYLIRKGGELDEDYNGELSASFIRTCFQDFLYTRVQWKGDRFAAYLEATQMTMPEYLNLYSPVARWVMEAFSEKEGQPSKFAPVLTMWEEGGKFGFILRHIIGSFPAESVLHSLPDVVRHIQEAEEGSCSKPRLWATLVRTLIDVPPEEKSDRVRLLNLAWGSVGEEGTSIQDFIECAESCTEFAVMHLDKKAVNGILQDVVARLGEGKAYEGVQSSLSHILNILLQSHRGDVGKVFLVTSFLPLLDMLDTSQKEAIARNIMRAFAEKGAVTSDPLEIGCLLDVARTLHDSQDAKNDAPLLQCFVSKVDYGKDYNAQLAFLVDCRRTFYRLDSVLAECVVHVLRTLQWTVQRYGIKSHSKKVGAFAKACFAYVHITIPSINDDVQCVQLFLLSGSVALQHGFRPQGEMLVKAALTALELVSDKAQRDAASASQTERWVLCVIPSLLSCAALVDSPDKDGLWVIRDVMEFTAARKWGDFTNAAGQIFVSCLEAVMPLYLKRLVHTSSLNEDLFAGDAEVFIELASEALEKALVEVERLQGVLDDAATPPPQVDPIRVRVATLCLRIFDAIAIHCEVAKKTAQLLQRLWGVVNEVLGEHMTKEMEGYRGEEGLQAIAAAWRSAVQHYKGSKDPALAAVVAELSV